MCAMLKKCIFIVLFWFTVELSKSTHNMEVHRLYTYELTDSRQVQNCFPQHFFTLTIVPNRQL